MFATKTVARWRGDWVLREEACILPASLHMGGTVAAKWSLFLYSWCSRMSSCLIGTGTRSPQK